MTAEQAIHAFWSGFGLTAYDENCVPDTAQLPYITYSLSYDVFGNQVSMVANIWYSSTSWVTITNKFHEISEYLGLEGIIRTTDNGYLWLKRGSPFGQRMGDSENNIKRMFINITAEYFQTE